MIDMILFLLIITLSAIFIFVVGPTLGKLMNKNDIIKVNMIVKKVVYFVEQTFPTGSSNEKKQLAFNYIYKLFDDLDISIDNDLIEVFIEAEVFSMKNPSIKKAKL